MNLVSVCVCTFRRPQGLNHLLASLNQLATGDLFNIELIIVDNDSSGSAAGIVAGWRDACRFPLHYQIEAESGVANARNRCLQMASGDWIAFIDDDEYCQPDWLMRLFHTLTESGATAAFGPVLPEFMLPPPRWIEQCGICYRPRFKTGQAIPPGDAKTGNVLMVREFVVANQMRFDPAFARSGGEDTLFFTRLQQRGAHFVWDDAAAVAEVVPAERLTFKYVMRRAFTGGRNYARIQSAAFGRRAGIRLGLTGALAAPALACMAAVCLALNKVAAINLWRRALGSAGKVAALWHDGSGDYGK